MKYQNYYWRPAGDGAWDQGIVQWHESGEYWDTYLIYRKVIGDATYDNFVGGNMYIASYKKVGDFLGGTLRMVSERIQGKWNDDIAWWALACLTGAEVFGKDAQLDKSQSGTQPSWFKVAELTMNQMLEQLDNTCKGGIYWSRNRASTNGNQATYKSTITNVQAMSMFARLAALNPSNQTYYKQTSDSIYAWLKSSGLITSDFDIYDGVDAATSCSIVSIKWSYNPGMLISALSQWYTLTKTASYLSDAEAFGKKSLQAFSSDTGYVEPKCLDPTVLCKDPTGYGWALFRGLADLHAVTSDAALKTSITTFIQNSVKRILNQCTADYNCVRTLTPVPKEYTFKNGTNPRDQIEAMEYLIALTRVLGAVPPAGLPTVAPVSPSGGSGRGGGSGGNGGNDDSAATHATIGFTSLFLSSLLVVAATFVLYGR
jgi:mannan endo-1,6-alpha-mannosidase